MGGNPIAPYGDTDNIYRTVNENLKAINSLLKYFKEKNITKTKYSNNFKESKPKPRRIMSASAAHSHRNLNPGYTPINCDIYNINNKKNTPSMFENYYHDKMVSKRLIPSQEEEKAQQMKDNLDYQFESHLRELRACNNIESQINEQYETIKKFSF